MEQLETLALGRRKRVGIADIFGTLRPQPLAMKRRETTVARGCGEDDRLVFYWLASLCPVGGVHHLGGENTGVSPLRQT